MTSPKILLLDIETAPAVAYIWQMWDQNVSVDQLIDPGRTICASWQWLGSPDVFFASEWDEGVNDPWWIELYVAMSQADAVVTYNGDKFDLPKLNGEFIRADLPPPAPAASIDLRKTVKKLGYISGKLAFVGPYLKIGAKVKNEGFPLWVAVLEGDERARAKMERYNKQDTRLLGKLYKKLRPYITNHPHLHGNDRPACSNCGSSKQQSRGFRYTKSFRIGRLQCQRCGSWNDGRREKIGGRK